MKLFLFLVACSVCFCGFLNSTYIMGKAAGSLTLKEKYELLRKKQAEKAIAKKEAEPISANEQLAALIAKKKQEEAQKAAAKATTTKYKLPTSLQRALNKDPSVLQREIPVAKDDVCKENMNRGRFLMNKIHRKWKTTMKVMKGDLEDVMTMMIKNSLLSEITLAPRYQLVKEIDMEVITQAIEHTQTQMV